MHSLAVAAITLLIFHDCSGEEVHFTVGKGGNFKTSVGINATIDNLDFWSFYGNSTFHVNGTCVNPRLSISLIDIVSEEEWVAGLELYTIYINDDYISQCSDLTPDSCTYDWVECDSVTNYNISNYFNTTSDVNTINVKVGLGIMDCGYYSIYRVYGEAMLECDNVNGIATPSPTVAPTIETCLPDETTIELSVLRGRTTDDLSWELVETNELDYDELSLSTDSDTDSTSTTTDDSDDVVVMSSDLEYGKNQLETVQTCYRYLNCVVCIFYVMCFT